MPDFLGTYDLKESDPPPHKDFVLCAEPEGWLYVFQGTKDLFRLPSTTLWGVYGDVDVAVAAFERARVAAGKKPKKEIVVEKLLFTLLDTWRVNSNKRKAPEQQWMKPSKLETCRTHQLTDPFFRY